MPDRTEFVTAVSDFLIKCNPDGPHDFGPEDNLFALGLVDSLRLVELIIFLEKLTGQDLPVENYSISSFYTINNLYDMVRTAATASGAER
jgi:acyl carrier protein